jgi:RNA recognition motif-containing protein
MNTKIFVGGLSLQMTEAELKELFAQFGTISDVIIIKDRETRQSKGFGFVTFEDVDAVKNAIATYNDKEYNGKTLSVSEARPKETRSGGSFGRPRPRNDDAGFGRRDSWQKNRR